MDSPKSTSLSVPLLIQSTHGDGDGDGNCSTHRFESPPIETQNDYSINNETLKVLDQSSYTSDGYVDLYGKRSIKSKTGGWMTCPYILGNEFCERLAYYGISTNLVVYLTTQLYEGNAEAAKTVNIWSGTCYVTAIIGAILADSYWGRYWTIAILSTVYCFGMLLLTLSASLPALRPPICSALEKTCQLASPFQRWFFFIALYLVALGTGGIKPCVSSFGADQFDDEDPIERNKKTSFFNWFYFSINVGALISSSVLVYIQVNISWGWGFGIPAAAMGIAIFSFLVGTPLYRHQKPGVSPLARIAQVFVAAIRKWKVKVPNDEKLLYELQESSTSQSHRRLQHTEEVRFLDKAAVEMESDREFGNSVNPWHLCTVTQVEDVKMIIRILPIWASNIIYFAVYAQMSTFFVEQGLRMDTHMGPSFQIPPASLSVFDTLSIILWIPIYDWFIVPVVRRFTGKESGFSQLQRMGIGLVLAMFAMIAAALVEIRRLKIAQKHGLLDDPTTPVPMSIFWQVPQYVFIGASETFTAIGQIEFFYDQSPDTMRSLSSALSLVALAFGNYFSGILVFLVTYFTSRGGNPGWIPDNLNRGHLHYFFFLLTGLSFLNILFYLAIAHCYRYKRIKSSHTP